MYKINKQTNKNINNKNKTMKTFSDTCLENFQAWSGAVETKRTILENNKGDEFDSLMEDLYPEGLSETALNDILWHDSEWCFEMLGISEEEIEENEE